MRQIKWGEILVVTIVLSSAIGLVFLFIGAPLVELMTEWDPNESPGMVAMVSAFGGSFIALLINYWFESRGGR